MVVVFGIYIRTEGSRNPSEPEGSGKIVTLLLYASFYLNVSNTKDVLQTHLLGILCVS